ncbi:MAG: hypothetical protein LC114_02890 [Bryobacterales bacterium]|nr:hypothetical protein [Bryobacterales bacterium]
MRRLPDWFPDALAALALLLLNAAIIWPLFSLEYPANLSSIEGAFIGLARHLHEHFELIGWFPNWYGGIPFQNAYPPLSHVLVALWSRLAGVSVALAYHQVSATIYCLIPVSVSVLALSLRAPRWPAWAAGLFVSLASPSAWLIHPIAVDMGGWRHLRRFQVLAVYGENPNLSSLLFCLISLALLARALTSRRPLWFALASVACGATVLTNYLGAVVLALGALAMILSYEEIFAARRWLWCAVIGTFGYGLVMPWLPPSTILAIRRNAPHVGGRYESSPVVFVYIVAGLLLTFALVATLRAMGTSRALRFSVLWSCFLGGIVLAAAKQDIQILPQAMRYHVAMEFSLALLVVLGGSWFLREALSRPSWAYAYLGMILVLGSVQLPSAWSYAHSLVHPGDAHGTIEAGTVRWLEAHLPGERVFLPGSVSQWADAFGDVPQFGGGFDNGVVNPNYLAVSYQIYSSADAGARAGEIAVTWLKAYGVRAIQVSLPESPEYHHPFHDPLKFDGLLNAIWQERGMKMYQVPARHEGLAFVIPESAVPVRQPRDGLDIEEALGYVAALEDGSLPVAQFHWKAEGDAEIVAALGEGQALSVQVSYHPGWEAWIVDGQNGQRPSRGERLKVSKDGLGQIVLRPGPGTHRVRLTFTGRNERTVAYGVSGFCLIVLLALTIAPVRERAAQFPLIRRGIERLEAWRLL